MTVTVNTMNQRQMGVIALAVFATLSLTLAAGVFGSSVGGPTRAASSGVFNDQNVTLKDPPRPSSVNLSKSPWLQVYYKYFEAENQTANATNASGPHRGGTDILPILSTIGAVFVLAVIAGLVWFRWLRSKTDNSFEQWDATASAAEANSEHQPDYGNRGAEPESDVHRAWYAMARHLDVPNADSETPRELAVTAIDRGLDREAVRDLTVLFERVRYGRGKPTSDREQRAMGALERLGIETGDEL